MKKYNSKVTEDAYRKEKRKRLATKIRHELKTNFKLLIKLLTIHF